MLTAKQYQELAAKGGVNKKGRIVADQKTLDSMVGKPVVSPAPKGKPNKYGAISHPDPEGGPSYPSTLELKHGRQYKAMVVAGEIMSFGRQPIVLLDGGITWKIDFIIHHLDGSIEYVESKGKDTPDFLMKEKLFRSKYPDIKLTIRRAKDKKK